MISQKSEVEKNVSASAKTHKGHPSMSSASFKQ